METDAGMIQDLNSMLSAFDVIDLSPTLETGIPKWPTHPGLVLEKTFTHEKDGYYNQSVSMSEHTGPHVDAPYHMQRSMPDHTIDRVPAGYLLAPAVVYDLESLGLKAGEQASAEDLLRLEAGMGDAVKEGEIALLKYGWEKYWIINDETGFYGKNAPGLDESAVRLFYERGVRAVGSDTVSCEGAEKDGKCTFFVGHEKLWLSNGILIMEAFCNLSALPHRCFFIAIPLKLKEGSGSPIRPIALIPKQK